MNNFRICLLAGCDGLEAVASQFRACRFPFFDLHNPVCELCRVERKVLYILSLAVLAVSNFGESQMQVLAFDVTTHFYYDPEHLCQHKFKGGMDQRL